MCAGASSASYVNAAARWLMCVRCGRGSSQVAHVCAMWTRSTVARGGVVRARAKGGQWRPATPCCATLCSPPQRAPPPLLPLSAGPPLLQPLPYGGLPQRLPLPEDAPLPRASAPRHEDGDAQHPGKAISRTTRLPIARQRSRHVPGRSLPPAARPEPHKGQHPPATTQQPTAGSWPCPSYRNTDHT